MNWTNSVALCASVIRLYGANGRRGIVPRGYGRHDGQWPVSPPRTGKEYRLNWSPVPVQCPKLFWTGIRVSLVSSPCQYALSDVEPFVLGAPELLPKYSGPEQEIISDHIPCLFWGVVRAIARRERCGLCKLSIEPGHSRKTNLWVSTWRTGARQGVRPSVPIPIGRGSQSLRPNL